KFYYCEGPLAHNITTRQQCEAMSNHRWQNQQYNFDNLGQALLTLFVLALKDGWIQIMYNGIDAVDVEMQPIKNYSEAKSIYFISFILINSKKELEIKQNMQKKLERKQRLMHELPYYAHFSPWRKHLHDLCISKYFVLIIAVIIGFNVITMSLEFYPTPFDLDKLLEYCNYVFTFVFLLEFIWKIVALGSSRYFKDKILKLLKMAKGIQALLDTVMQALPQVGNLGLLFFLFFFIFTILGVELFGKSECSEEQPCSGLNKHAHFKNSGIALLTLFRIATGDNWNGIMKDSNTMIADDAEMDEEIERQLESDVHDENYVGQLLLDVNALDVKEKVKFTKL
ncbi:unnamed protein product, partial [Rotaria sp. Silwood1]